jgi:hypothetical protein
VTVNPGGGSGWDEAPLDIQIPDDARELDRDVLAYHRELRAQRRRNRLRRLTGPFSGPGTVMPLLASILAVCLVAGAMLSVATFSPSTAPADHPARPSATAGAAGATPPRSHTTTGSATTGSATASSGGTSPAGTGPSGTRSVLTSVAASPSGAGSSAAGPSATRASHPAKASARSSASTARASGQVSPAGAG